MAEKEIIVLASHSSHKLAALRQACEESWIFGKCRWDGAELVMCAVPSGVNAQPVGFQETMSGALNRLLRVQTMVPHAQYWIAIESGAIPCEAANERHVFDIAVAVVERWDHCRGMGTSSGISVPIHAFEEAGRRGLETTTFGRVLADSAPSMDATDPHAYLTRGYVMRWKTLFEALRNAFAVLPPP